MRRFWLILVTAAALLLLSGCGADHETKTSEAASTNSGQARTVSTTAQEGEENSAKKGGEEGEQDKAVPVEVHELGLGSIEALLRSTANLEVESQAAVFAQTTGIVKQLLVEEGDRVERGALLLKIEDDQQRSRLRKAESQLDKQRRENERYAKLFKNKLISEQEYNESRYQLEQLQIAVDDARRDLAYTAVRAPIRGTISNRAINLGERVQAGAHLFDIVDFDTLVARIYIPEKELRQVAVGQQARVSAKTLGETSYAGRVERISPVVDPQNGTVKVTVAVGHHPGLRPGMYTDVALVTRTEDGVLLLPKRAVVYDRDRTFVYKVGEGGRVSKIAFEIELSDKNFVKPMDAGKNLPATESTGGLAEGDMVVVAGQIGIKNGTVVEIVGGERPVHRENDGIGGSSEKLAQASRPLP